MNGVRVPLSMSTRFSIGGVPVVVGLAYLLLYIGLDRLSFIYPMRGFNITPWNPQAALAVGMMLWTPRAWWVVLLGLFGAELIGPSMLAGWPPSLLLSGAKTSGYVLTAVVLRRQPGARIDLSTRRQLVAFLIAIVSGTLVSAVLYIGVLAAYGIPQPDRLLAAAFRGWMGDAVGLLVTLPLMLTLASAQRRAQLAGMTHSIEWWLITLATTASAYAVFAQPPHEQFKFFYLLFLPAVWSAARFGVNGAVWSSALTQVLLITAVLSMPYHPLTVFEFHLLVAVLATTGLLLGTTFDEREEAARTLRASLHLAAAGDMTAALAHELNQPLTALSTYARAAQFITNKLRGEQPDLAPQLLEVTNRLVDEANRASGVVTRLRNFFRDRVTELQPVDLAALVREVVASQTGHAESLGVQLLCDVPAGLPEVWLDEVQIGVVLRNLIANAVEAASASPSQPKCVTVHAMIGAETITVAILDSGAGVGEERLPRVFESQASSKPGGMGIGLRISRAILEAHGGRLWAEPGPGGKFMFSLPLSALHAHE